MRSSIDQPQGFIRAFEERGVVVEIKTYDISAGFVYSRATTVAL